MKKLVSSLLLFSTICYGADNTQYLIQEMESLRSSLSVDDPSHEELTLRLADLYFDASIKEGEVEADQALLKMNREKALSLYTDSLAGKNGLEKAKGLNRIKVQFQMARLLTRLNENNEAEKYYLEVSKNEKTPKKLQEQAALGLAEWYEESARFHLANTEYKKAIELCEEIPACNYAHYRRAWLLYKDTKLPEAISELKLSLWDKEGMVRENSLQDLIMFMSNNDTDGLNEFTEIKALSKKINQPELVQKLTEAFYVAGNRKAGSNLLAEINKENNNLYYEVRLLEEFYGFRNWDKVQDYLASISKKSIKDIPSKKEEKDEVLKIMRRFIVQVDAEAQVIPDLNDVLKRSINIYLTFYPNDELRKNMQQGWLKATTSDEEKIARIGTWIEEDIKFGFDKSDIRKLRQTRLSMAQKLKKSDIVIHESLELKKILKGTEEEREFTYVAAREFYALKQFDKALPLFKELSDSVEATKNVDEWALLSQNLVLDIYNNQKNYSAIMAQVDLWKNVPEINENKKIQKDLAEMNKVYVQADFEKTASLGESKEALQAFFDFCFNGVYPEKSCVNAKVLSVKLKDQPKLVSLLEKEKDEMALMTEYELMGRFKDAAKLQEKFNLQKNAEVDDYLKIALLYELDQDFKNRDRVLTKLTDKLKRDKKIPSEYEAAIFVTLQEADLLNYSALSLPWSLSRKITLANRLDAHESTNSTKSFILSQKESTGPTWAKHVLSKVQKAFEVPSKISFYGNGSQWKFKKRTKAIDDFATLAKGYLEGASSETRVYILEMLKSTYQVMAMEIQSTPIPEGLDDETLNQVMTQLSDMAKPFETVALDYSKLQENELTSLKEKKDAVIANLESGSLDYAAFIKLEKEDVINVASFNFEEAKNLQAKLNQNPEDRASLSNLENFYEKNKSMRIASYFKGRVNNLSEVKGKVQ